MESLDRPLKEGSSIGSGFGAVSYLNRAPHPNAAKVFINWLLTREGQAHWTRASVGNSLRTDVAPTTVTEVAPDELKATALGREENYPVEEEAADLIRRVTLRVD